MVQGYNLVILPSSEIQQQAITWSTQLSQQYPTTFTLDGTHYHPHLTLYQSNFPTENLQTIIKKLTDISAKLTSFSLDFDTIKPFFDFVFYQAIHTPILQSLHEEILGAVSPLRDPNYHVAPETIYHRNINTYGCMLAMQQYLPHITVTHCTTEKAAEEAAASVQSIGLSMQVSSIFLTNVDHDGTCTKIYQEFSFAK